ncbi:hypothetical protein [Phaeobacter italicus]|uniref:hypothetical protein n=1 Tax=Phaeobacter italicus TaxID=481446 RepID=UPI001CD7CEA0|nr:hypothetical protein [Phaeobacter italicus]MCA0858826.1 hypothetical protein [Phaeobacter italicus]
MLINQPLGQHTLSLFLDKPQTGPNTTTRLVADMTQISVPETRPVEKTAPNNKSDVSPEQREMLDRAERYTDTARQAKLHAAAEARHEAGLKFYAQYGYKHRLDKGLMIADSMASRQKPGEAAFDTRQDAMGQLSNRMGGLDTAMRERNLTVDFVSVPRESDPQYGKAYSWNNYTQETGKVALSQLSEQEQQMDHTKRAHDIAVTRMDVNVAVAELARDFGVKTEDVLIRDEDGGVSLADFEIVSSQYGKLAEVKDGQLYAANEDGSLVPFYER